MNHVIEMGNSPIYDMDICPEISIHFGLKGVAWRYPVGHIWHQDISSLIPFLILSMTNLGTSMEKWIRRSLSILFPTLTIKVVLFSYQHNCIPLIQGAWKNTKPLLRIYVPPWYMWHDSTVMLSNTCIIVL